MTPFASILPRSLFVLLAIVVLQTAYPAIAQDTLPTTAPVIVLKYSPPTDTAVLHSTFVEWDSLLAHYTPTGQLRSVWTRPTPSLEKFEMHITTLRPGMISHPVHRHPWEEILLIKEGTTEVSINGRKHRAGPGCLIFYASNDPHNIRNAGDTPATYYVMNFCTERVHTASDESAAERADPDKLPSSIIDCNAIAATPTPTGSTAQIVKSPTWSFASFQSHITTLNAGQGTKPDITDPGDELFILKSGQLEATVAGVTCRLNEGSFFYCAPNDKRTFKNIGATPAVYQVIKILSDRSPNP